MQPATQKARSNEEIEKDLLDEDSDVTQGEHTDFLSMDEKSLDEEQTHLNRQGNDIALRVVAVLGIVGALSLILFSDLVLRLFGFSLEMLSSFYPFKGWICLALTLPAVYWVTMRLTYALDCLNQQLERKEKKLSRINCAYHMVTEINHALLRIRDREQLLKEVCKISQLKGGYAFVWAGLGETDEMLPEILVTTTEESKYLQELFDGLQVSSASERGEPALAALRKRHHVVINDVVAFSKKQYSWQKRAIENGYLGIAAFPIKTTSGLSGVFAIYTHENKGFFQEEVELIRSLMADIGYALSDIEQKEQLYYVANFDVVTNLPNRQLFEDRLKQTLSRACHDKRLVGLAIAQIQDLSKIIETHGQAAGDKMLLECGKHLSQLVRDGDTIGRIGQNEIGILLADVAEINDIGTVMQKLMRPFLVNINQQQIQATMRAGVAVYPHDADSVSLLIKHSQDALKGNEENLKNNCLFYSKEMTSGLRNNQMIEQEMKEALEKGEFSLYYQPIVDVESRLICGAEVLTRWRNNKLGEVSPVQFIPVAEETGLIEPLGKWIIKSACQQLGEWKKMGFDSMSVSVNLTAKQLMHANFIDNLRSIFFELKFDPKNTNFGIEITESTLINDLKRATDILVQLREMGVKIYIDDFGTGAASLSYLHQLPVDALKIDSMFVRTLVKDQNIKSLVKGIIALANGLNLKTIAEGVETEKQLKSLQHLGCQQVQGYFFSPPMLPKNLEPLIGKPL